jgi:polysaccharide biosynthesis transport protein
MFHSNQPQVTAAELYRALRTYPVRWLAPAAIVTVAGLIFTLLVHEPMWEAGQALTVREEASLMSDGSGRFTDVENLKHVQETILELATNPTVVTATLREVGPPSARRQTESYPNPLEVAAAQERIQVVPPKGAEFGTTRLFYVRVRDPDPRRAVQLTAALCDQFEQRFQDLRGSKVRDVINELTHAVNLARCDLEQSTAALAEIESSVGTDLGALRMLNESIAGESNLQTTMVELRQELRHAENQREANQQLQRLLDAATDDPSHLVATPHRLLESQPALRQLKEGLIAAQLITSNLLGTRSPAHPQVAAARAAEEEIRGHLHRELEVAIRGLQSEQAVIESQILTLSRRLDEVNQRMLRLAAIRADYGKQVAEVRQQTENLTRAQQELAQARASQAAGESISLITRIDAPRTGPTPAGPGRATLVAAGLVGGLLVGLGLLVLTTPIPLPARTAATTTEPPGRPAAPVVHELSDQRFPAQPPAQARPEPVPSTQSPLAAPSPARGASSRPSGTLTLKEALTRCADRTTPSRESNHVAARN